MTRNLVTVQAVKAILPISGADKIELCVINGWQVVVAKGRHAVGELVLFYEIDSFLPAEDPRYVFLDAPEASGKGFIQWGEKRGARLKTIKMRKQLSQGLVLPIRDFPEVMSALEDVGYDHQSCTGAVGFDVTEILKIEKWEPIEKEYSGNTPGTSDGRLFPAFIRKTDQARIQNIGDMVQHTADKGEEFEVTVKKDGSSLTVFRVDPKSPYYMDALKKSLTKMTWFQRFRMLFKKKEAVHGICSRNMLLPLKGGSNFHKAAEKDELLWVLDRIGGSHALQGELLAPNIQNNYEKVSDVEFHLFDIFDIDKQKYLLPEERHMLIHGLGVKHARVLNTGPLDKMLTPYEGDIVTKCLAAADGPGDNPGVLREGIVFKSMTRDFSFKAVSDSYLLKTGK